MSSLPVLSNTSYKFLVSWVYVQGYKGWCKPILVTVADNEWWRGSDSGDGVNPDWLLV